jgi:hypothetical protein
VYSICGSCRGLWRSLTLWPRSSVLPVSLYPKRVDLHSSSTHRDQSDTQITVVSCCQGIPDRQEKEREVPLPVVVVAQHLRLHRQLCGRLPACRDPQKGGEYAISSTGRRSSCPSGSPAKRSRRSIVSCCGAGEAQPQVERGHRPQGRGGRKEGHQEGQVHLQVRGAQRAVDTRRRWEVVECQGVR